MNHIDVIDYCAYCGLEKHLTIELRTMYGIIQVCEGCYKAMCNLYLGSEGI
jgi:hypothetical protein